MVSRIFATAPFEVMRMFRKGQFKLWIEAVGGRQPAVRHLCLKTEPRRGNGPISQVKLWLAA